MDGLIYASSMVMLDSAHRKMPVPALARWLLDVGIAATLAANIAHGLGHGFPVVAMATWPAVALVGSYELLMMIIRGAQLGSSITPSRDMNSCTRMFPMVSASWWVTRGRALRPLSYLCHERAPPERQAHQNMARSRSRRWRNRLVTADGQVALHMSPARWKTSPRSRLIGSIAAGHRTPASASATGEVTCLNFQRWNQPGP